MELVAHLFVFTISLTFCEAARFSPELRDLAERSPITSTSSCGQSRTKYCDANSLESRTCTEKVCDFGCCSDCTSSSPKPYDLKASRSKFHAVYSGTPRPGKTEYSLGFDSTKGSKISVGRLPFIDHRKEGFTICVWVNQSTANSGTIFSKSSVKSQSIIYGVVLEDYSITLYYIPEGSNQTETIKIVPLASQYPRTPNGWHFICVMVVNSEVSYFLDGEYIGTDVALKNAINDQPGRVTLGQMDSGDKQYDGLMQDIFLYSKALTNREVTEAFTGNFPTTYIASQCRCPPTHPKISTKFPAKCTKNWDRTQKILVSRLSDTSHPIEFATDADPVTYWLSETNTNQVTIDMNLLYGQLQVFHIMFFFYGPLPAATLIERSSDRGQTYSPWQYYADDCKKSFGMQNNGKLSAPDDVNCALYQRPYKYNGDSLTFRPDNPGKENLPIRPYGGGSGCNDLYCSPKLLEFIKATNVRIHFYNHTLVTDADSRYFGLSRLTVAGRCECYGHAKVARYITPNATNNGSCVCECEPSTNTEGDQCDLCKPMYNDKPFRRGSAIDAFPCVKCECHDHASSCRYNRSLDAHPEQRGRGGGGVCINCRHNTAGQRCDTCREGYYREPGKALNDPDVCSPCRCNGAGVQPGFRDCVKDDSSPDLAGQCQCRDNVTGRLCDQCKPGFYDLNASHKTGCRSCDCDTRGTTNGSVTCDVISGQCHCKANVTGRRCDQCKAMFYNLSSDNPHGCQACLCNMTGSTSPDCHKVSGQCPCQRTVTGRQCERCDFGFHSLNDSGCQPCNCSALGTRFGALQRCDTVSGRCQCKNYVTGYSCERCMPGYYDLRQDDGNGCKRCQCDIKGTVGNSRECHALSGNCSCKTNVTGVNCDQCPAGFFNLSASNPDGCEPCLCHPKGTKFGDTKKSDELDCQATTGQCLCLSYVQGRKCDRCREGYVWNQAGQGCISCNCDADGSVSKTCNDTGFCICKPATGVGGQFCDKCLPGYHSFNRGSCSPCNCNQAGITQDGCDAVGCLHCKQNVEGTRCQRCKPGTKVLKQENPFGCSGVPSQQGPPIVHVVSSRVLQVTWDPPDQPNGLVTNYALYRNGTRVHNGLTRDFNDTGLQPYTWYAYYIITRTDGGSVRSLYDGSVYRTKQDVPSGVARPSLTDVGPRTAKAAWSNPTTPNGVLLEFVLESTNLRDPGVQEHCRGLLLRCDVTRLRPYTVYNFTVRACTLAGCTKSETSRVLTRPTAPDSQPAPVVVPLPGGKMFSVAWDEPAEPNGVIFRYELYQRNYPSYPGDRGRLVYFASPSANPGIGNLRNTTIRGLVPFTLYEFRVATFTDQVSGFTSSNWTRQRTAEAVPEGESAIRPQSYAISSSAVNISWQLPSRPYGVIVIHNIYIYTNQSSYSTPVFDHTVNDSLSTVVHDLQPYSVYQFTVVSCNSVGCTGHSARTETRTLPSAPSGQPPPTGEPLNSSSLSLTWSAPANPNGPVPPDYHVSRSHAAFHYPPINAIDGVHFPGLGYYRLSSTVIPSGIRTYIEFSFRTRYSDGLLVFLASSNQDDYVAVELRNGVPLFIFNCQTGVAQITIAGPPKFDDERWHHVKISRYRQNGDIIVDGVYKGTGRSPGTATVVDANTGVYIGGFSNTFRPKQSLLDSINSLKLGIHFVGCLKELRLHNNVVSYEDADEKVRVDPLSSGCPLDSEAGVYLKGGGFMSLNKDVFDGQKIYALAFDFRTYYSSGLLLFVYGEKPGEESYLALVLDAGDIRVLYRTTCCQGNVTVSPAVNLCDGQWHRIQFANFGKATFSLSVDGEVKTGDPIKVLEVSSELYFGGVPQSSPAAAKASEIGLQVDGVFGGCLKNIVTSRKVDFLTDVASLRNADLGGCPKNVSMNITDAICRNFSSTLLYSGKNEYFLDNSLTPFTDYLYRVESKQPGTEGGGKSPWLAVRSGEGAPEYRKPPYDVTALDGGESVAVYWLPPHIYHGVLRGYKLRAYNVDNSSAPAVERAINDVDTLNATLKGLEPFTLYDFRVAAFTNGGEGESPGARVVTEESVPEHVLSPDVQRFPYSLFVSWRRPLKPNGVITNYSLSVNGRVVYGGLNQTFNVTSLPVYSRHVIKLTACTRMGCTDSESKTVYTAEIPPQGVNPPKVVIRDAHSADVSWDPPDFVNGIMRGYQVLVTTLSGGYVAVYNTSADQFAQNVTNLTAGTWYVFHVNAINGGGATRSPPTTKRTVESSPEDIPPPDVRGLSPHSILVTILEPRLPNGNITRYELFEVIGQNEILVLNGTGRNYTRGGLTPYTAHDYRSRACTAKGCGSSDVGTGYTLEAAPNGTVVLNVSVFNATTVWASWTILHTPNGVVSYGLSVSGVFLVVGTSSFEAENATRVVTRVVHPGHEVLFTSLLPYTAFRFQINASNTAGFILSNIVDGTTGEGAPFGVAAPNVTMLNSTAAQVTWPPPARDNGILLFYEVMIVDLETNTSTTINNGLRLYLVVTNLEPYTKYLFRVSASTAGGKSWSPETIQRTLQDIPDPVDPPKVPLSTVDSRSLVVHWDHATKPNGVIIHYVLYRNHTRPTRVPSNVTMVTVTGLEPFTVYVFGVSVCNVVGCSGSSLSDPVRTLEDVPENQSSPVLSHAPGPSVWIRWSAPTVTNGRISHYQIQRRLEMDLSNISFVTSVSANLSTEHQDTTVKPCTAYQYRVIAFTRAGGTPSTWSNITTGEGAPDIVAKPSTRTINSTAIHVTWSRARSQCLVTGYIIRVLENHRNYSGFGPDDPRAFTVTSLLPYTDYNIVVAGCTVTACRDSAPSMSKTSPSLPRDQPPPTATPLDYRGLRVTWESPEVPAGRILEFRLFRRTLDEPVSENFTTPPSYVMIYRGILQSFDDRNLGIFSEQQYKVMVINTEGNTTSNDSLPSRTGPAAPQGGALLHGVALNHTSILLNWTLPELKLLRGYVVSYKAHYRDLQTNVEYTYVKNLDGSARNLVVSPLKPSRDYRLRIILFNGNGSFPSNDVTVRTMDGAPEGFGKPDVRTINSTTIEVQWLPPTTPNGKITTYVIYANATRVGNTSELHFNATSLTPFTVYEIQVEVCTVYACVRSDRSQAKTLPAVPELLDPPGLLPGRRNMMVAWDPPRRPNGLMLEYKLFRRRLKTCPTRPPPVTQCTYIECPLAEQLCGSTCYSPTSKICCGGVVYDRDPTKTCCDDQYLAKSSPDDVCCSGRFYTRRPDYQCCYGFYELVRPGQICCMTARGSVVVGDGNACCGGVPYSNNTKYCVCGTLYDDPSRQCCGGKVITRAQICCGGTETDGRAYDQNLGKKCCGSDYVLQSSLCCKSNVGEWKVYNYSSIAARNASGHQCCETNRITAGQKCCNGRGYDDSSQVCADISTLGKTRCGTGTVCNKSAIATAVCNRCDFNRNTLYCGHVVGYYTPVSPTPPSDDCGSEFAEISSGNGGFLSFSDVGLEPFTGYEYYVVGRNTEGNVSSTGSRNTTLMDAPEGLSPPIIRPLSARSIEIQYEPPRKPNGIISEYKVTRIEQNSSASVLVYQGANLSYVDTSVRPFAGYFYILEACTTICSNVSSGSFVYTMEAIPEDVPPPILKALSSSSVEVSWGPPERPNGVIIGYNISRVNATNHTIVSWQRNNSAMVLVDDDLRPFTNYTYTVTACTKIGCSTGPRGLVMTLEAAPEGLSPPVLIPRSARSVEAYWNEPAAPNGRITWYALYRGGTLVYNGTEVCLVGKASSVECTYVNRGLDPHTWYYYSLEASTVAGSTRSNGSKVRTPESSPEGIPPPTLSPQSSTSIHVTWTAPPIPNGVIVNYSVIVDTLREHHAGLGTQLTVTGLRAYTGYSFQVKACTVRGCGVGNRTNARTLEAPPQQQPAPRLVALSDAVVRVTWRPPLVANGIIISYEVERRLLDSVPVVVFKTTRENGLRYQTLNSGLLPYRIYSYRIRAINGAGGTRGPWATVRTLEGAPSGVYPPVVHVLDSTAVLVSWQQPRESNGHIIRYELWSRELNNPGNATRVAGSLEPQPNVTVSGLKPNTDYEFQLAVSTVGGTGYSQWTLAETLEAPPLGLRPLRATKHANGRELTLTWGEPAQPNGVITDYIVYSDGVKVYSGIARTFSLARLQPYTSYTFQLEACTSAGCTRGATQVITTAEIPPRLQQAPTFSGINSTFVNIEWRPPALPYGEIRLYQVLRSDIAFPVYNATNQTTFTDRFLEPYTMYEYKVRVENSAGGTESSWASVTTSQAPPSFVSAPVIISGSSSFVDISWIPPTKPNGVVRSYTLRRNDTVIGHWGSQLTFRDRSVVPATYYSYWITVCTGGGCTDSATSVVKTGEGQPGAVNPPTLTVLSAIAIRAEWNPPVVSNGFVTHYELYMDAVLKYNGSRMTHVVSNLSPFTSYAFHVRACTRSGCTAGASNSAITLEAAPEGLDKPTYTVLGPRALEIKWSPPAKPNGIIRYYVLRRNNSVIYNGTELRFNDLQILPYTYYAYVVTAANTAGQVSSESLYANRTSPDTPENVTAPVLTALSGTEIRVSWSAPGKPNGEIIEYFVLYNNMQINVGVNMSYVARQLSPYTLYSFRVRACTSTPPCADSIETSLRTLEGLPRDLRAPEVSDIRPRSVFVRWGPPSYPNGEILRYILLRLSNSERTARDVGSALDFTDTSLKPYHGYQYKVLAVNSVGNVTSPGTNITTRSAPPENVPKPRILVVTPSSIVIAVDPPVIPNGEIIDYKLAVNGRNVSSGLLSERKIENLEPYVDYHLRVFACTRAGCTPSGFVTQRTAVGVPGKVQEPSFGEVTATSIHVRWQPPRKPNGVIISYFVIYKFVCSENCVSKRAVSESLVDVGLNTSYVITNLQPYTMYEIVIRVQNENQSSDSDPVRKRTGASDPNYVRQPVVTINGDVVSIDWSKSFKLNGPLAEYILYENEAMIFRGLSTESGKLTNRGESEFVYVVSVTTTVNGEKKTVKSIPFTVNVPGVSRQTGDSDPWYETIWFLAIISIFIILAVFGVVALCLRRTSGDRTVYVRERDPLPVRPKSRSGARSLSSNYTPSEAHLNIGMKELSYDTQSRASTFIGEPEKVNKLEDSAGWEPYTGSYGNPGWFDDDKTWTDDEEPYADKSTKYQVFTDTHL